MKRFRWTAALLALILTLTGCAGEQRENRKDAEKECSIGVIFYGERGRNDQLSDAVFAYADYLEQQFDVRFTFASSENTGHLEATRQLCEQGVDVILNANTEAIPESVAVCEEYQVYWLQILDLPTDTDIVDRFRDSPYYLGSIINDDQSTSRRMTQKVLETGAERIGVTSLPDTVSTSVTHTTRADSIMNTVLKSDGRSLEFVLKTYNLIGGLQSMAAQGFQPDALITTTKSFYLPLSDIQEIFGNERLKVAYFDLVESTRQDLENGSAAAVACGQHNILGLAFAYAYHYVNSDFRPEQKLALTCDYILIGSAEEYDLFQQYCIEQMPYSKEELQGIIDSLDVGVEWLREYANSYDLQKIVSKKS